MQRKLGVSLEKTHEKYCPRTVRLAHSKRISAPMSPTHARPKRMVFTGAVPLLMASATKPREIPPASGEPGPPSTGLKVFDAPMTCHTKTAMGTTTARPDVNVKGIGQEASTSIPPVIPTTRLKS